MEFKKFSVGNFKYGDSSPQVDKVKMSEDGVTNVNFSDPVLFEHYADYQSPNYEGVHRFMEILSVCHTVIAEKSKHSPDHLAYNASSPDELALVNAAKYFGYSFKGRDEENNVLVELKGSPAEDLAMSSPVKKYRLLNVVEFTSTRKRMTVIVRSLQPEDEGAIRVMCKGADSIIIPRLRKGAKHGETLEKSKAYLEEFSKEGLRTLVIAEKRISDDEYHMWNKEY